KPSLGAWVEGSRVHFRVWAPERQRVDAVLQTSEGMQVIPLVRDAGGYFSGNTSLAQMGDRYRFRLDGAETYPDPSSRFQPEGVHGASEIIDPSRFRWNDQAWKGIPREALVLYELHVGTFSQEGTFEGVHKRLKELAELGITAVELMPLSDFPGRWNWGYDG